MEHWLSFTPSPDLTLHVAATPKGVSRIILGESPGAGSHRPTRRQGSTDNKADALLRAARRQLTEYFQGKRKVFDLPLDLNGTPFQRRVWNQLRRIPYGVTRSYGEVARAIGKPGAARAVGQASGANPVPILVPCHRVIAAGGALGGYGGGLRLKRFLLALEQAPVRKDPPAPHEARS